MSLSRRVVEALDKTTEALDRHSGVVQEQMRVAREQDRDRRWEDPEFQAALKAIRWPLRPLTASTFLRSIPGLAAQFRAIPEGSYQHDSGLATVLCPCGARPSVSDGAMHKCDCGRVFLHAARKVYIAPVTKPTPQEAPVTA